MIQRLLKLRNLSKFCFNWSFIVTISYRYNVNFYFFFIIFFLFYNSQIEILIFPCVFFSSFLVFMCISESHFSSSVKFYFSSSFYPLITYLMYVKSTSFYMPFHKDLVSWVLLIMYCEIPQPGANAAKVESL